MQLFELIDEYKSKQLYYTEKSDAEKLFILQKKSIEGISNTQGFKEIRDYWRRIVVACNDRLRTIKTEDIKNLQGELNAAMDFLSFLDNLASEDLEEDTLDTQT